MLSFRHWKRWIGRDDDDCPPEDESDGESVAKLQIQEFLTGDGPSEARRLLQQSVQRTKVVNAGRYTITYKYDSEIRFGPPLYRITVDGPGGDAISRMLSQQRFFQSASPYHPDRHWLGIAEWRRNCKGGSTLLKIIDLDRGVIISKRKLRFAFFQSWRGGDSCEYVIHDLGDGSNSRWLAVNAKDNRIREIYSGLVEGHVTADGKFLIAMQGLSPVSLALVGIGSTRIIDQLQAADFHPFTDKSPTLYTLDFDAASARLTCMLNCTTFNPGSGDAKFEKLITIHVSR